MRSNLNHFIYSKIESPELKNLFLDHAEEDRWRVYDSLENIRLENLNSYDQFIYHTVFARSLALNYHIKRSINHYQSANELDHSDIDSYTLSYFKINYSISLGYSGLYSDVNVKKDIEDPLSTLKGNKDFIDDVIRFEGNISDIAIYNRVRGLSFHILRLKNMLSEYSNRCDDKFISLRLGVLYLHEYMESRNKKSLIQSKKYFEREISVTDDGDYRNYWAKCGRVICQDQLGERFDRKVLQSPPSRYKSRAKNFPIIIFMLVRARYLAGDISWVASLLRQAERTIKKEIEYSLDNFENKAYIINKYKPVIDEWCNIIFKDYLAEKISEKEAARRIIKVNEIYSHRLLSDSISSVKDEVLKNNLTHFIEHFKRKEISNFILYTTDKVNSMESSGKIFTVSIDIKNDIYAIHCESGSIVKDYKKRFANIFKTKISQSDIISLFESAQFGSIDELIKEEDLQNSNFVVIPNSMLRDIPYHQISKNKCMYWPNLTIAAKHFQGKRIQSDIAAYFDPSEDNAVKEIETLKTIAPNSLKSIPAEDCIEKTNRSIIHNVSHFDGKNILINKSKINYQNYFKHINSANKLIVLNICKGGAEAGGSLIYQSLPHYLLQKGALAVISNRWYLSQESSLLFSKNFYGHLFNGYTVIDSFYYALEKLKNSYILGYGGYTLWGNGNLRIRNGS